jgi:ABC-type multidrug transport system, ATPase component
VEDVEACCNKIIIMQDGKILREGTSEEIRLIAKGKVFQVKEGTEISSNHFVERTFERNGENFFKSAFK